MIALSVAELAEAAGAVLQGPVAPDAIVRHVVADSRQVQPGSLFVALPGERVDGRDYVAAAVAAGAVVALTAAAVPDAPCLVVPDPLAAFGAIARRVVDAGTANGLRVVGVTGSQGKTSTKDLLAAVLESVGPTVAPFGNLNNELGLPLTIGRLEPETRYLVAEMGARGIGHIAYLCSIAPPHVGIELNVGHAHVGEFGGQAAIARAKSELVAALPVDGTAVLNADDPYVWDMRAVTSANVFAFSAVRRPDHPDAVWAQDVRTDDLGRARFSLHAARAGRAEAAAVVQLRLVGRHHVANAAAAAAAALALGARLDQVASALSEATARSRWRMELTERDDGLVVLNDAYNANPESMAAALDALAELGRRRGVAGAQASTTWALLGDMLELGDEADAEHAALGRRVAEAGVNRLIAVGGYAPIVVAAARSAGLPAERATVATDKSAMTAEVIAGAQPRDVVLVKASRGLALDTVAADLLTADPAREPAGPGWRASGSEGPGAVWTNERARPSARRSEGSKRAWSSESSEEDSTSQGPSGREPAGQE